jgi:hypothetical protein
MLRLSPITYEDYCPDYLQENVKTFLSENPGLIMVRLFNTLANWSIGFEHVGPYAAKASLILACNALVGRWESARIIGLTTLVGMVSAITCNYTVYYESIRVLNRAPVMREWTIICSASSVSAITGTILATLARMPCAKLPSKVTAKQLVPYLIISTALIPLVSHIRSRRSADDAVKNLSGCKQKYYRRYCATFLNSVAQLLTSGTAVLSTGIVAARAGLIHW